MCSHIPESTEATVISRTLLYDTFRVIVTTLSFCLCFWNIYPQVRQYSADMMKDNKLNDEKGKVIHEHSKLVTHIPVLSNRYLFYQISPAETSSLLCQFDLNLVQ